MTYKFSLSSACVLALVFLIGANEGKTIIAAGLSCNHCNGGDCETFTSEPCTGTERKCYMHFDSTTSSVDRMGCLTEQDASDALQNLKYYYTCETDNCNTFKNLPWETQCASCNSETDETCATHPASLSTVRCGSLPYTGCFSRVTEQGHTVRGCVAQLADDIFSSCVLGSDSKCNHCTDDNCNKDIFPITRTQCHRCNTKDTSPLYSKSCEAEANSKTSCPIYSEEDSCVTKYENGVTSRGCGNEIQCNDGGSSKACRKCTGTGGCNDVNLAQLQLDEGAIGVWQELPVNCYHCSGKEDCAKDNSQILRACLDNIYNTCYTVFDANNDVIERGCRDAVMKKQQDYCDKNSAKCINCKSNGCNTFSAFNELIDCYQCDQEFDCLTKTTKCHKHCMVAFHPTDDTVLYKGCLNDKDMDDQLTCKGSDCFTCETDECNNSNSNKCYKCSGDDCKEPIKYDCQNKVDQCYIKLNEKNSLSEMGCQSEYTKQNEIEVLIKAKTFYTCFGEYCNEASKVKSNECSVCDSEKSETCATHPDKVDEKKSCNALYSECYMKITDKGHTIRGCLADLAAEEYDNCLNGKTENCKSCTGDKCNNKSYPENRLACHRCKSKKDSKDDQTCFKPKDETSGNCPIYKAGDKCVATYDNSTRIVERNCASTAGLTCKETEKYNCHICTDSFCNKNEMGGAATMMLSLAALLLGVIVNFNI